MNQIPEGKQFEMIGNQYIMTEDARCYSLKSNKFLKGHIMQNGYVMYSFGSSSNGTRKQYYAHRLMAWLYLDIPLDSVYDVEHKDNNRQHNHYTNLVAVSRSVNESAKNIKNKGVLYAIHESTKVKYGPFKNVRDMQEQLHIKATYNGITSTVSRKGRGYGYIFVHEHASTEVTTKLLEETYKDSLPVVSAKVCSTVTRRS